MTGAEWFVEWGVSQIEPCFGVVAAVGRGLCAECEISITHAPLLDWYRPYECIMVIVFLAFMYVIYVDFLL
jgi:hypothetical protein